jgi:hypothetical protein
MTELLLRVGRTRAHRCPQANARPVDFQRVAADDAGLTVAAVSECVGRPGKD